METFDEIRLAETSSFVKSAAVAAGLNYISGREKKYPWEILGLDEPPEIRTSYTIGIDSVDVMLGAIKECAYPLIKIKLGFEGEADLIRKLGDFPDRMFRVDANGAWSPGKAEEMMYYLDRDNVEIVEQPTSLEYIKEWKYLKGRSKFHLMLDEGLGNLDDYFRYADYINGVNIKMAKSGGIFDAVRLARQARKDKLKVMLGCMVESSIGIAPSVYISSLADYFDLDGPLLLEKDLSDDIIYVGNAISVSDEIIGGPVIKKEFLP